MDQLYANLFLYLCQTETIITLQKLLLEFEVDKKLITFDFRQRSTGQNTGAGVLVKNVS